MVITLGWLFPRTAGERTVHFRTGAYIFIHLLGLVLTFGLISVMASIGDGGHPLEALESLLNAWIEAPFAVTLGMLGVLLMIELAFLVASVIFAPWGAQDEPLWHSIRWSHKRLWLATIFAAVPVIPVGFAPIAIEAAGDALVVDELGPRPVHPSRLEPPDHSDPQSVQAYEEAWQEQWRKYIDYRAQKRRLLPAFFNEPDPWLFMLTNLAIAWFVWSAMRTIGAHRPFQQTEHEPNCEQCGYNLTSMPDDAACPECGTAVSASLPGDHRTGASWARPAGSLERLLRSWFQTADHVIRKPADFARTLRTRDVCPAYRSFLLGSLLMIGAIALVSFLTVGVIESTRQNADDIIFVILVIAPLLAMMAMICNFVQVMVVAAGIGLYRSIRSRRNLFHGTVQVAAYGSAFLVLWALIFVAFMALSYFLQKLGLLDAMADATDTEAGFWVGVINLPPNIICFLTYFILVIRGTAEVRFANR